MTKFEDLFDLIPMTDLPNDGPLAPEPVCARLSDVLTLVEPRLGPALLDTPGRAALRCVADRIPVHLSSFWGLEIRLGDPARRADFLWEIRRGDIGIETLAGRNPYDPAPDITAALRERSVFWREMSRFAGEWLDNPDWLRRLGNIWLEVDAASEAASPGAALDARLDRPSLFWGSNPAVAGADRDLMTHLAPLGRRFYGLELDPARIDAIARTIPAEGEVFQMGVMGGRDIPVVRLCVKNLDSETAERWLAAIAWPGDRARLRDSLARLTPLCGETALNVDILPDRVGPKLGLEIYSAERSVSTDKWRPLHDALLTEGLARADKLAALMGFPSFQQFRQIGAWSRDPPLGYPVLVTNLHHLKLVFVGETGVEAKAYLGVFRPVFDYSPFSKHGGEGRAGWL